MSQSQSPTRSKAQAVRRMRPTTARGPRFGVVAAVVFHGLIFAAALFTLHQNFKATEDTHVVPVDLVTIAEKTNVAAMAPPTPPTPEKMEMPPSQQVQPLEPHMSEAEPAPDVPMPTFKVAKPTEDDDNKPKTQKQQSQDFAALLNKLTTPDKPVKNAKAGPRVIQQQGLGNAMTADLISALQSQIYKCWSPPTGAPDAADLVVDYTLSLNPDGTVGKLQLLTLSGNTYTRAAAEAASRAIYQCQPYRLPQNRYDDWKEISRMRFDPRQLMEQ
jgi:hypothetical protein